MCYLRRKLAEQFANFTETVRINIGDTGAFYYAIVTTEKSCHSKDKFSYDKSAEDEKLFLLKQTRKSLIFLDWGYFLSGWQCPASTLVNPSG